MEKERENISEAAEGRSEETGQRKRHRVSKVWDHFKLRKKEKSVQCVYCKSELAYHNSTTSMLQHLNRKHPVYACTSSPSGLDPSTSQSQRRMDSYVWTAASRSTEAAELTDSILNMIVTDMRPLSMVEDEGFQRMISTFNPRYTLPSRTYFMKIMEKKYEDIKGKLTNTLKETDSIALTTDIWTSVATEAYLGVTCHFLGKD
ncbi:E3 SUMO-protein ligase ZBED1-like [Bufo bufo]|uniref:E3 SUMO-protein ligase ZBED1-like n=1 Tax=Bufo bufo TaxID=8384 RepID=UPI001ABDEAF5|nr:E3 SUMO-protein ligase ZBED1-like [Bufo bufo]